MGESKLNKEKFEIWLRDTTKLADYTIKRYIGAPFIIDTWLRECRINYLAIYSIDEIEIIEQIQQLEIFKVKNRKGGNMYGAALNHYKKFLINKNKIDEDLLDIGYIYDVERQLPYVMKESSVIIDLPEAVPEPISRTSLKFNRNHKKCAEMIVAANFTCEYDRQHKSFISEKTKEKYCEGHHLVPMEYQKNYNVNLDVHANIVSLCPNCHRILHHAILEEKLPILEYLLEIRKKRLNDCGIVISFEGLINLYKRI